METLNAAARTPFPVLGKRTEPRKNPSQPSCSIPRSKNQCLSLSRSFHGGLVLLSSLISSEIAKALSYDEALQPSIDGASGIDINSAISFAAENPVVIGGGLAAALAVPLLVSQLVGKGKAWGVESARSAYAKLGEDENAQLLDVRSTVEIKGAGRPDLKGLKKKAVGIVYKGEDKVGFLDKLSLRFKEPQNTTLFILDKFDGNSELVAELVTANGFKAAYAIKDGAEGPKGWKNTGLPWIPPKKGLSLDFSSLTDAFGEDYEIVPLTLGIAAAAGLGIFTFTEVETILQVLGSAALVQFISKKLLFAELLSQANDIYAYSFKHIILQEIGKALLPSVVTNSKALPAPVEQASPVSSSTDASLQKSESIPQVVNSVSKAQVQKESLPIAPRPLSPYPNYPDYKPPSSPIPSQP
ncbi:Rhodanese-like domain-containing protein 4-chloroplastic [Striga hermonthica]|uniref:Rhodanese-like domain-containing protein 4-chloroplastic n=1 Tax=Striga hermonthica TaxID=68872 RepID=A0A9N7RP27_STRHE|nr:Rhodanese-like domain-containing protein 4-chloroplastic [Striga hermonthica]